MKDGRRPRGAGAFAFIRVESPATSTGVPERQGARTASSKPDYVSALGPVPVDPSLGRCRFSRMRSMATAAAAANPSEIQKASR